MAKGSVWMLCEGAVLGGSSLLLLKAEDIPVPLSLHPLCRDYLRLPESRKMYLSARPLRVG